MQSDRRPIVFIWSAVFFVIALISASFGFVSVATAGTALAQNVFFVTLALGVLFLIGGMIPPSTLPKPRR